MTNYREILRLKSQGYSERNIALAASCSRNTVSEVLQRAEDHDLTWPLSANVTNADLKKILYPPVTDSHKRLPDYNRVRKELMRNNTKTAVVHNKRWEDPQVNRSYHELAEHYGTAIIPARIRHPKDEPSAEGNVGHVSTWIIAALRDEQFFSLAELNKAIQEKLKAYNDRKF